MEKDSAFLFQLIDNVNREKSEKLIDLFSEWHFPEEYKRYIDCTVILNRQIDDSLFYEPLTCIPSTFGEKMLGINEFKDYPNVYEKNLDGLLILSVLKNRLDIVKSLVEDDGISVETKKEYPLRMACLAGHFDIVEYLLLKGANPDGCKEEYNYPICFAISGGHTNIVDLLILKGANPRINDDKPLVTSFSMKNIPLVEKFLNLGADINADNYGLLASSIHNEDLDLIKFVLLKGAKINDYIRIILKNVKNEKIHLILAEYIDI